MRKVFKHRYFKLVIFIWTAVLAIFLFVSVLFYGISQEWFGNLPDFAELENPRNSLASEIYSSDGVLLGKYYIENRSNVAFKDLSPNLVNALIATEDVRFYEHSGIDFKGTFAIVLYTITGRPRGSSTITQQLAKNLFGRPKNPSLVEKVMTKFKEWVTAARLEQRYTKEEIITLYLNTVAFSGNAYGIKSASKVFFNKHPSQLNVSESALLVGMLKGITLYNPVRNPDKATVRRNTVLGQMQKYGYLSGQQFQNLKSSAIELKYKEDDHNQGLATYFREHLRMEMVEWCEENGYDLYKDGLKIYTTIDSRLQKYAEEAMSAHMKDLQLVFNRHWKGREPWGEFKELLDYGMRRSERYRVLKASGLSEAEIRKNFDVPVKMRIFSWQGEKDTIMSPMDSIKYYKYFLQSGFMSMNPKTGHVKAWVGGINHKYFKYDHVNKDAKRQIGSTFKPFVYTLAIDNGWSPCFKVPNIPVTFEDYDNYTPKNADGKFGGEMDLYHGLMLSVNNIVAYLMKQLGPDGPKAVIDLAGKMGVTSKMEPYPSLALGAADISVFEMVGAYSTYANKGVWTEPIYIARIEDKNGNVLKENVPRTVEAMNEQTAYVMIKMMEKVVNNGTAYRIRGKYGIPYPAAGKTGTTQNNSDGWFIGITPELVSGLWVGNEDRAIHFRTLDLGSGSNMALPVWALFMQKVYKDKEINLNTGPFEAPKELNIEIDCSRYQNPSENKLDFLQ